VPESLREPRIVGVNDTLETLQANMILYLRNAALFVFAEALQLIQTLAFLVGFLVIPFWLFYVLNSEAEARAFVDGMLHLRIRADFWNLWRRITQILSDYIRGQLILGVVVGTGMLILRLLGFPIPYIMLLAIVSGVTELIPIIGPNVGAIPSVLALFTISPAAGLAMLGVYAIVQQLENNLLVPWIIGASIAIHPAILTIILFAAAGIFGLISFFLAAPVAAIARDLFVYTYRRLSGYSHEAALSAIVTSSG
jgi:predicted PurR-regulated permease PerM